MAPRCLAVLLVGIVSLAGCGSAAGSSSPAPSPTDAPSTTATPAMTAAATPVPTPTAAPTPVAGTAVTVARSTFMPPALLVPVGGTVTWTNTDTVRHSATAEDGLFDGPLPDGGTFTWTFGAPGTYAYHCRIHPRMKGTIVVG